MTVHPSWWGSAFEQLAAVSPARFVVVRWEGDDGTVEWANAATAALMDLEVSDIIGRRVSEVYPDRYLTEIAEQFRTAREQGSLRYEVVRELAAGRVTLNAATVPLGEDLFLSYALDVTVERETQRQLALVTELTGAGLYHWNLATDEVSWNDEMFRLFGHEPGAFVPRPGRYLEHVHPEDRSMVTEAVAAGRAGGAPAAQLRHRIVRADGQRRTVDIRAQAVTDGPGERLYVFGVVRDVTDEVELQRHEELVRRAAQQQRTALTVHDRIVQALATVVLALNLDEIETAREEALAAVGAAQAVVSDLLAEVAAVQGSIEAGALRVLPTEEGAP